MKSIFVDNDITHILDVHTNSYSTYKIKISEESSLPDSPTEEQFNLYTDNQLSDLANQYSQRVPPTNLYRLLSETQPPKDRLSRLPNHGMTEEHFDEIDLIIDSYDPSEIIYVFLDFDRTLTQSEGVFLLDKDNIRTVTDYFSKRNIEFTEEKYIEDMAKFLFGADRMIMLRDRLRSLQQKAEVFILTANTACHSRDKRSSMLIELIRQILPTIDRQHVLCSSNDVPTLEKNHPNPHKYENTTPLPPPPPPLLHPR